MKLLNALLPGFVAAWIFYGLTPHPKRTPFERVVQALIFTAIVQVSLYGVHWLAGWVAVNCHSFGPWTQEVAFGWSVCLAILIGFVFAGMANNDWPHRWIRQRSWHFFTKHKTAKDTAPPERHWIWSKRTSYPSEWFSALNSDRRYVVLHFKDRRRLFGWPEEFPDQANSGHFVIWRPKWLLPDGTEAPMDRVDRMIIPVARIAMVEIMKWTEEITVDASTLKATEELLIRANQGNQHGEPSTTTPAVTPTADTG